MERSDSLLELAGISLACRDGETLLRTFAARLGPALGARAVLVWLASNGNQEFACRAAWSAAGERLTPVNEAVSDGLLSEIAEDGRTRRLSSTEIRPDQFLHIEQGQRPRLKTALLATLRGPQGIAGAFEVLNKSAGEFTAEDQAYLEEACRLAGQALSNLDGIEAERHSQLEAVERLTALYDLSRIFNSTLELDALLPIVAGKIQDILGAQACNLWLVDPGTNEIRLAQRAGEDPSIQENARLPLDEGHLGETIQRGSARVIENADEEPSLEERRRNAGDFEIQSVACAPLRKDDEVLGAVELINKTSGDAFDEDDLFFLSSIAEQAAVALHNANLLESERKVHVLDALLKISQEITSSLNLDKIFTTAVHQAATVVPFDKCAIGFFDRGRFVLGAVSGEAEVPKSREMEELSEILENCAEQSEPTSADHYQEGWEVKPAEDERGIVRFLEGHEYNGFYALPLRDEEGKLGVLGLLSSDAEFLTDNHRETLAILTSQVAVAIRNAQLYQQVPLAGLLQPLAEKKQKILAAVPHARSVEYLWRVAAVAAALAIIPWPMRVGVNATVIPAQRRMVTARVGGVVQRVLVREADTVSAGQELAQIESSDDRVKLVEAQTNLAMARRDLGDAEFQRNFSAAEQARLRSGFYEAQVQLEQERVNQSHLLAPIGGMVVTPKVEEKVGVSLKPGDVFCEVVAQDPMAADMNVPEKDLPLLHLGSPVALKLNAYPAHTFHGTVDRIGGQTISEEGEQFFVLRASFRNPDDLARDGMAGRARIEARGGWFGSGWYPVGYAMFRSPVRWMWREAWSWIP